MSSYYYKNKERILKGMSRKVYCEICDKSVSKSNFPKHCRTEKHKAREGVDSQKYLALHANMTELRERVMFLEELITS